MRVYTRESELVTTHAGVLVPTMGALHQGHAALIEHGAAIARDRGLRGGCIVSIFVNPTQFNQASDFDRYPRTLDADLEVCRAAGADAVFTPSVEEVYYDDRAPVPPLPPVATEPGLEDRFRPGHFAGVCQVVARLFRMARPAAAVFGEKDWQQLQVVSALTRALALGVEIVAYPTLRDPDGLAMSSRNRFLSVSDRERALAIPRALRSADLSPSPEIAGRSMSELLAAEGVRVEYAVVRDPESLRPIGGPARTGRALIAAWSGSVRLIDNAPWQAGT